MRYFDANACIDTFCKLCEEAMLSGLITAEECQYWVFEYGYQSANASIATFSKLCDEADNSDLISAIDCQYWLFERGYLAAKQALECDTKFKQIAATASVSASHKKAHPQILSKPFIEHLN